MDTLLASSWFLLIVSLPTGGATARMRIWRKLKALGCVALRDGAYLLPAQAEQVSQLTDLAAETSEEGGQAWLLRVQSQNNDESASFQALFDRSAPPTSPARHSSLLLSKVTGPEKCRQRRISVFPSILTIGRDWPRMTHTPLRRVAWP